MPVKNGRIYINKDVTPNEGVSVHEIAKCIGAGTLDLGKLCEHVKVNMWSRMKPNPSSELDLNYEQDWWKFPYDSCAVNPPARVSTFYAVLAQYDGKNNGWQRAMPGKYRDLDFNGYYHWAKPPVKELDSQPYYFKLNDSDVQVSISYNEDDVDSNGSGSLKMSDMTFDGIPLSQWYIGLAVFNEDGSLCKGYIATQQGEAVETIHYPNDELIAGTRYLIMPFYSSVRLDFNSGDATERALMSIPIVQPVKFLMRDPSELLAISAEWVWASDKSSVAVTVNVDNEGYTFINVGEGNANARLMVVRNGLTTPDDYWSADLDSASDYEFELDIASVPLAGTSAGFNAAIPAANKDLNYVLLVRIYTAGINFDYGPEEIQEEIELG